MCSVYQTTTRISHNLRLTSSEAHAIVCVTGLETRSKAVAVAVKGGNSTRKITDFRLLGRLGRTCPGVSLLTFPTQSPLFCALESAKKVTERPQAKEA